MPAPPHIVVPGIARLPVFSHASIAGGLVFVAGTLGTGPGRSGLVDGGAGQQTRQALANVREILQAAGADLADVVKVSVYLTDMADFGAMNEAYAAFFPDDPPPRITLQVAGLALGAAVEIECIARARG